MAETLPEPEPEESMLGRVIITCLVFVIAGLLAACGYLWTAAHDAKMQAQVESRIQVMKAKDEADRAKQQADLLRGQMEALRVQLESTKGSEAGKRLTSKSGDRAVVNP